MFIKQTLFCLYSLYKHAEIDYKGRIERIDTYNKKQDIFVTLQLLLRKNGMRRRKMYSNLMSLSIKNPKSKSNEIYRRRFKKKL